MVIRRILTADEPILREKTKKVTDFDASLHRLLDDLLETMRDAPGIGLAANQVGVPLQVAVIEIEGTITELVNPKIVRRSGAIGRLGGVPLDPRIRGRGRALGEGDGPGPQPAREEFRVKGDELFARALQHEIDHLNGVLYIDYLESLEELVRVSEASDEVREEAAAGI